MQDKIADLLKVLDLSEEEQILAVVKIVQPKPWLCSPCVTGHAMNSRVVIPYLKCEKCEREIKVEEVNVERSWHVGFEKYTTKKECSIPDELDISLADLAFRLRDEVSCMQYWWDGVLQVYQKCKADFIAVHIKLVPEVAELGAAQQWYANAAQPIHFIIASLIAKQLAKENTNVKYSA